MAGGRQRVAGRFVAGGDLRSRYAAIEAVLRVADPERPLRVSMRQFDAARAGAGHSSLPRAQDLSAWLAMPWQDVKAVALDPSRDPYRTYASRKRVDPRPWSNPDGAVLALQRVAKALGQNGIAATTYDRYRNEVSAATRKLLPSSPQIVALFGSWSAALTAAELETASAAQPKGFPVVDAIAVFVRTQGRLPSRGELEEFAADPRWAFPLQSTARRPWQEWMAAFEAWWVGEVGRSLPETAPRSPFVPLSEEELVALPKSTRPPKGWWTRERVIACVVAYLEQHPEVTQLQQRGYRAWAKEQNAAGIWTAAPGTLTRHGTLEELETEARYRLGRRVPSG